MSIADAPPPSPAPRSRRRKLALLASAALVPIGALGAFVHLRATREAAVSSGDEGGTGSVAKGEEGAMGDATSKRYGVQGPADAHADRQRALREANEFGMIGTLDANGGGDPNAPAAPWGRDDGKAAAMGNVWGPEIGLSGVGEGGGGRGIGLGSAGTIGHGAGAGIGQGIGSGAGPGQGFGSGHGRLGGAHRSSAASAQHTSIAAPPDAPIDPNGRFATTYRPGGGHLAAFESAVARGIVPADAREIVSDVGARYAPSFDLPQDKALGVRADFERAALPPTGGPFHLRVALRSSDAHPGARPHLSVHLVLDVSGSMAGEAIQRAKLAANALVDKLDPTDDFSLVTFSNDADLRVPDGAVGARRGFIHGVIDKITDEGGTNIGAGLTLGYQQATTPSIPEDAVRVVLLLSDGHANAGVTSSSSLSRLALDAFQKGIQTSSFGLGSDYDGALMSAIAADGAGGYYYLRDADQIAPALATELDRRLDPVATAVEVRVRLKPGVELLRVYGSRRLGSDEAERVRTAEVAADVQAQKRDHVKRDRQDDAEGGIRFFLPAFARDDAHALLFKLRVAEGIGQRKVGTLELKYKDRLAKRNVIEEVPLEVAYADGDAASAASVSASVVRTVQGFAAGETLSAAAARIADGDRAGATALLAEREAILRQAAARLEEPLFLRDAARMARLRSFAESQGGIGEPLVLAMILETAGNVHMH